LARSKFPHRCVRDCDCDTWERWSSMDVSFSPTGPQPISNNSQQKHKESYSHHSTKKKRKTEGDKLGAWGTNGKLTHRVHRECSPCSLPLRNGVDAVAHLRAGHGACIGGHGGGVRAWHVRRCGAARWRCTPGSQAARVVDGAAHRSSSLPLVEVMW
jgi:hypothetical protein